MKEVGDRQSDRRLEATYCRAPMAVMFNGIPNCRWITNPNLTFSHKFGNSKKMYESGRPDAFACWNGHFVAIECKAGAGKLYLGDTDDATSTRGWHAHQRDWYTHVAVQTNMSYWLAVWVFAKHKLPVRVYHRDSFMYLVPPDAWLALEQEASTLPTKTVALLPGLERIDTRKDLFVDKYFAPYRLLLVGSEYRIPAEHPLAKECAAHE